MSAKAKNILSYWRLPLYFFIASIITLVVTVKSEKLSGVFSALWLFVAVPGFAITFIIAIVRSIKNSIVYRGGDWPEEVKLPEIELFKNIGSWIGDEVFDISYMSGGMRIRYILFRVFGIVFIIGGIVLAFFLPVIGALVIIAGAALCIMANPRTYNEQSSNVQMISCHKGDSIRRIHGYMKNKWTPLGTPFIAKVSKVKGEALVWGPSNIGEVVVLYHARFSPCFYVSSAFGANDIIEYLTSPESRDSYLLDDSDTYDVDDLLMKIATEIENNIPAKEK